MKKSIQSAILAVIILAGTVTVADAQGRRYQGRTEPAGECMEIPGLTDSQKEKINAINETHRAGMDEMRTQLRDAEDILVANELRSKMALERNSHLKEIAALLDKDQKAWFDENVIKDFRGQRGPVAQRGPRGPRGHGFENGRPGRGTGRADVRMGGRGPRAGRCIYQ